ncbi:MAG: nucleotidyltransferase family protein [Verrucomicrobia bacterium]|nr:nucleotidyltransferase family protein [Verrucomicrobiota bacterium]
MSMTQQEVFETVVRLFDQVGVRYMLCGSVAAMAYGEPRYTNGFDFVIAVAPSKLDDFHRAFSESGFYVPAVDVMLDEFRRHRQFNLLHNDTGIKIDCMVVKVTPFGREEFERRQLRQVTATCVATVARPEDVILGKLEYCKMGQSEKHLHDIRGILRVSGAEIDLDYVRRWVKELGLEQQWNLVQPT